MNNLLLWWDSYQSLSSIGTVLKFIAAGLGILILIFGLRESSLRSKANAIDKSIVDNRISKAEAATKPRVLTLEQKESIGERLKAIPEKCKIFISASVFDGESMNFAKEIESLFLASGFDVYFPQGFEDDASIMISHPGLHLVVKDIKAPPPLAVRIQRIFTESDLKILGIMSGDPTFEADKIEISVGQK